jgi:rhomboid protease GluP
LLYGVVYLITSASQAFGQLDPIVAYYGALDQRQVLQGEWWRLITYAWLHANPTHLVMNALLFVTLGHQLETLCALAGQALRFSLLLLWITVVSTGLFLMWLQHPAIGASGIGFGLMAAYMIQRERQLMAHRPLWQQIAGITGKMVLVAAVFTLYQGGFEENVAVEGHLAGLVAGAVGAFLWLKPWPPPPARLRLIKPLTGLNRQDIPAESPTATSPSDHPPSA